MHFVTLEERSFQEFQFTWWQWNRKSGSPSEEMLAVQINLEFSQLCGELSIEGIIAWRLVEAFVFDWKFNEKGLFLSSCA